MAGKVKIGDTTYAVVPARNVMRRPHSLQEARALARRLHEANPRGLAGFVERQLHWVLGATDRDIIEHAARGLFNGELRFIRDDAPVRRLSEPEIRDLVDPANPVPTDQPPRDPRPRETQTWISFDVVDDHGRPANGEFRLIADSTPHGGVLDDGVHRYDALQPGASAQVYIDQIVWPYLEPPGADISDDLPPPAGGQPSDAVDPAAPSSDAPVPVVPGERCPRADRRSAVT